MKIHNLWVWASILLLILSTFGGFNASQHLVVLLFQLFCVLFWYLGEIRILLQSIKDKR